ncbi:2,3-dihydroxy-p-cumate/2,3-dihydroxybenzoate 3,4-dioxygenase [Altererythrobacter atlanticus]|uniref:Biphenyl-2,3-diol 1,2-dioxygenase n=1 Tax=Croceibacterium atlanticum TaxID=1267766 RepID=A0A0F7KQX1_9SPHN|nr:VOC family protein [Croceibacterium atlanticum]AKH42883.1 Biphenyl-2,3-diol 1,2-dioxygenase [Croceibacterium atlanticum]MBB5731663.1 2,3-dihydroxy-p-cumate/2,3-dihydroxybenzoate 3,4-dioxygenase [Croceibacterium atlanticum]
MTCVSDLQFVALAVPDLAAERKFFGETWGLVEVGEQDGRVYFAAEGRPHPYVIVLREDAERKTDLVGFSAASREDLEAIFQQVKDAGAKIIAEPGPASGPAGGWAFRFFDPDGHAIEVLCDARQREFRKLAKGEAIPEGISHVVFHSPDHAALAEFYQRALGFRLSDWIGDFMVFLRCNPAHHRLAILPGPPALNHIAFDVSSVDELMRGLARMHENSIKLSWGPGRHTAGNNTFSYFVTPNGNVVEYTSDLEEVDEDTWQVTRYEPGPTTIDQWGTGRIITGNVPHAEMAPDKGLWQVPA